MSSEQLARTTGTPIGLPARYAFDADQVAAIKRTVAKDCSDPEFVMFLEVVGRYGLDPFAKQVYAVKMPGKNGAAGKVEIMVSRDGLLALANRQPDFEGMEGDVVREGDQVSRTAEGFAHTYDADEAAERLERPIVGAWARVYRRGRRPTFFLAPMHSYRKDSPVWKRYPDAMISKVAESAALRKAFSISGVVGEDEVEYREAYEAVEDVEPDWGEDEHLAAYLKALFERANELRPNTFRPAKIRLELAGADYAKREHIAGQLGEFIERHGGEVPERVVEPDAVEA